MVIPVYNGSDYIAEAIESAIGQESIVPEVIVVNDGSTDHGATARAVKPYLDSVVLIEKPNGGVASALNEGIRCMHGEWFSWLSHDDRFRPHKLRSQIDYAHEKNALAVFGAYAIIDGTGRLVQDRVPRQSPLPTNLTAEIIGSYPINGCTTLLHRNIFGSVGLFDEALPTTNDYDMWFRISLRHEFLYHDEVVLEYRVHELQGSHTLTRGRLKELDFAYGRMARQVAAAPNHFGIPQDEIRYCIKSLAGRKYWSAARKCCTAVDAISERAALAMREVAFPRMKLAVRAGLKHAYKLIVKERRNQSRSRS